VPLAQKQSIETFGCENGGGKLHVVEGGVRVERSLERVVVVGKSVVDNPLAKSQPMQEYLGFTHFVEKPPCTKKVHLASGDKITKTYGMESKPLEVQEKPKAFSLEGT